MITQNVCYIYQNVIQATSPLLAKYSHIIPILFILSLALLVFVKSNKNILSKIFLSFSLVFSVWLIGDLITWTSVNYYLIYTVWSFLLFLEVVFFVLGLYFIMVFVNGRDITWPQKLALFFATLIPLFFTLTGDSVLGFDHSICGAINNNFLDQYKLYLEIVILLVMFLHLFLPFFKKNKLYNKKTNLIVTGSMFLFLAVFGITEYLAAFSGNYEINLYALFITPLFLMVITYSIFKLDIFNLRIISTYFIVFGFLILAGVQLFFVNSTADRLLTAVTVVLSAALSFILFQNLKRESDQRIQIEKLNIDLGKLIQQRESLVHLITHKVKGSFTHTKYIFSGMIDGMFGPLSPELKKMAEMGVESDDNGVKTIDLILNASNLQKGTVKYEMKPIDFKEIILKTVNDKKEVGEKKGLKIETEIKEGEYKMNGDLFWLTEVTNNLIENSIRYTKEGTIIVGLVKNNSKILFSVKDTGIGITLEDKKNLFTEGGRGKNSVKVNVDSTGYGLYTVKLVTEAHGGKVWAESGGEGMGATFFVEFNAI